MNTALSANISAAQVDAFAEYCIKNFHLETIRYDDEYQSMPACILDCIYSLRAKYYSCTVPVVDRYAQKYMSGNRFGCNHTLKEFIDNNKYKIWGFHFFNTEYRSVEFNADMETI